MEPAQTFIGLGEAASLRRRDLRVSEMLRVGHERFLILERTDLITILYEVDLASGTNIFGGVKCGDENVDFDEPATVPSLEQLASLASACIVPLGKT